MGIGIVPPPPQAVKKSIGLIPQRYRNIPVACVLFPIEFLTAWGGGGTMPIPIPRMSGSFQAVSRECVILAGGQSITFILV